VPDWNGPCRAEVRQVSRGQRNRRGLGGPSGPRHLRTQLVTNPDPDVGDLQQLLAALREVTIGGSVVDPQVVDALVSRRARLRESPLARLTPRELDVLREMAQGRGNAGIAAELSLSESSVEKYVNAIFAKLDLASEQLVHRRVAAVLTFLRDAGLRSSTSTTVPEALPLSCRSPRRAYPRRGGTGR
jgi:DNA-binding CsgD family transcriptional regulator